MSIYKQQTRSSLSPAQTLADLHPLVDESRTTGNGWHLRSRIYPTGDVEVLALNLDFEQSLKMGGGAKRRHESRSEMDDDTLRKSQRRAKKIIRQKILTFQADRILTLTYRENQSDIGLAWRHFNTFNRKMKWRYGENWQYVCVPELQKRGAVHFHLAVKGFYHANTVRRFWRESIKGDGNIDISTPKRRNGSVTRSPKKIAGYLAKYLSKQETTEFNKRRYSSSALQIPPVMTGWLALGVPVITVLMQIVRAQTRMAASVFEADGYLPLVYVST